MSGAEGSKPALIRRGFPSSRRALRSDFSITSTALRQSVERASTPLEINAVFFLPIFYQRHRKPYAVNLSRIINGSASKALPSSNGVNLDLRNTLGAQRDLA